MSTPQFIQRFRLNYGIALVLIVLEILFAQGLIQQTLSQERAVRNTAYTLGRQRVRELYFADNVKSAVLDPSHRVQWLATLTKNNSFAIWQQVEAALYGGSNSLGIPSHFSDPQIEQDIANMQSPYTALNTAYSYILAHDTGAKAVDITPQLQVIMANDTPYVLNVFDMYTRIENNADGYIMNIQWLEIILCIASLGTLLYESTFAIRPALKQLNADLTRQQSAVAKQSEMVQQIVARATIPLSLDTAYSDDPQELRGDVSPNF